MEDIGRRTTFALGIAAAAAPALILPGVAAARTYGPNEGQELAPGVRLVAVGKAESTIPSYKTIEMVDIVFQPGSTISEKSMPADMVCHMTQGEVLIKKASKQFSVKENEVYTCIKGEPEEDINTGSTVAVMRAIILHTA
jgi:quercetin dioxygenase-like cupin family protein